jgi:polysaccharide biosynthesis/export protein
MALIGAQRLPSGAGSRVCAAPAYAPPTYAQPPYAPAAHAPRALAGVSAYAPAPFAQPAIRSFSGDRLRVVVFGQEGVTNACSVNAGSFIDMPLIGPVLARGATTDELAGRISEKLRDGFIRAACSR